MVLRKVRELTPAAPELAVGILALAFAPALIWSFVSILFTSQGTWKAAGLIQWIWLVVVIVMPLIGSMLFLLVARSRLSQAGPSGNAAAVITR